jgi:hypothetical protein
MDVEKLLAHSTWTYPGELRFIRSVLDDSGILLRTGLKYQDGEYPCSEPRYHRKDHRRSCKEHRTLNYDHRARHLRDSSCLFRTSWRNPSGSSSIAFAPAGCGDQVSIALIFLLARSVSLIQFASLNFESDNLSHRFIGYLPYYFSHLCVSFEYSER